MVQTSRRGFVKGAAASCIALANIELRGFDSGAAVGLPNPIFAYEFGDITPVQQAGFAREYGFEGTVFDHARQIPERLQALDEAHLQLFFLWLTVDISNGQIKYEPGMEDAIQALKGRGTVVWVAIQGGDAGAGPGAEERTIQAVDRISDESLILPLDPTLVWRSIHTMAFTWPGSGMWCGLQSESSEAMWAPRSISAMNCAPALIRSSISYWLAPFHACTGSRSTERTERAGNGAR
jgi:hypothetical protein